jgi:hypothetical protein
MPRSAQTAPLLPKLRTWFGKEIATLYPGCFALVMATGIISNGLLFEGHRQWSDALFAINSVAYPWLMVLTVVRFVRFRQAAWSDLINPRLVFSFFTIVAGTDVFGIGLDLRGHATAALCLWLFALLVWLVLIYFSFAVLTFLNTAVGADVIHGAWLNAIDVGPDDITPLLWVVMGAAAISTNAGSVLIATDSAMPFLNAMRPFIDGVTLTMWAWATWWIPLLLFLGVWKHGVRWVPPHLHADALEPGVPARHACASKLASLACGRLSAIE